MEPLVTSSPGIRVSEIEERATFGSLEHEWNDLVRDVDDQPFYRHELVRIWIDNFAAGKRVRILLGRDEAGRLTAVLPLVEERTLLYGMPVRQISAAANAHSCRFDLIARDPAAAADAFLDYLLGQGHWDVIRLTDVPDGGGAWRLHDRARERGLPVGVWPSLDSPRFSLPATREALDARLHGKFKANLRRRRRRLEEKGRVSFERWTSGPELEEKLEEGFRLEESGWKGERGTAIAQSPATRGFYTELARAAQYQGRLALSFLRLDGRAIAFHYALEYGGRYLLLKPAYDESLAECSPGQLLMDEVVSSCIARKLNEFDFLGPDMPWKRDWAEGSRQHAWLFIFRDGALGRMLCGAKFRWLPAAKDAVGRWRH